MTAAMDAVLREEWHGGGKDQAVRRSDGETVAYCSPVGPVGADMRVLWSEAEARALLMANALRMVRLLREIEGDLIGTECCDGSHPDDPHQEWCRLAMIQALLRDLGIEPEPAEAKA